ncbi:hypothetical protein MKY41_15035 [Sporosarcina sp. FSL W7-1349]|uniref:hypothetical protein n=1 Tax=Sporosarcina sp. FSL W7-1349 TaxID=2921561 RepID=UPI0030FC791F
MSQDKISVIVEEIKEETPLEVIQRKVFISVDTLLGRQDLRACGVTEKYFTILNILLTFDIVSES